MSGVGQVGSERKENFALPLFKKNHFPEDLANKVAIVAGYFFIGIVLVTAFLVGVGVVPFCPPVGFGMMGLVGAGLVSVFKGALYLG